MSTAGSTARSPTVVLFLPGTINTGDTQHIHPRDPSERLAQYEEALTRWIGAQLGVPIVFAENSGADLGRLKSVVSELAYAPRVEFLSFADNAMGRTKAKGQGEMRTFEYALDHSELFSGADLIWKVTGRYYVRNCDELLTRTLASSHHGVRFDLRANLTFADTRCFFAEPRFLREFLLPRRELIDDEASLYVEHAAARAVHAAIAEGMHWEPLAVSPNLLGIAGVSGRTYDRSVVRRAADRWRRRLFNALLSRP